MTDHQPSAPHDDALVIGGKPLRSRLFMGTGKFGREESIPAIAEACGSQVITVALRRVDLGGGDGNILAHIPLTRPYASPAWPRRAAWATGSKSK